MFAATRMHNTRSSQLFVNLRDNSDSLDSQGFAPVGRIVSGMEVVDDLYAGYGDMPPNGAGPDPTQIQLEGNAYLTRGAFRIWITSRKRPSRGDYSEDCPRYEGDSRS